MNSRSADYVNTVIGNVSQCQDTFLLGSLLRLTEGEAVSRPTSQTGNQDVDFEGDRPYSRMEWE